jgi:magnesium transporter
MHRGEPNFLHEVKREYLSDFVRHAASPSFLLFELWDHLLGDFASVQKSFEDRVEQLQKSLVGSPDESIFRDASEVSTQLLHFRKIVLPARTVLADLSTRKSSFVSEASQGFLGNMVGTVERILHDVLVDRDILSDSLNNYMSMVAYNTNKVMGKLTVVSVIFLPLTFLCGVYGMNFEVLPELKYEWAYAAFWCAVIAIALGLIFLMRRVRML